MTKKLGIMSLVLGIVLSTSIYAQNKYALLIGVDYEGRLALDYTRQDAIKLGQILKTNFGYTTKVLTRQNETTQQAIKRAFSDLKELGEKYDQIIVFFSGHGVRDENSTEVGYLLPNDVDTNDLFMSAIDMSIIQNLSKTLRSRQVLFILDCCYSGIIGSYANMAISGGDKTLRSRQILTAGRSGQTARMWEAKELSLYTYYLTRALCREGKFLRADSDKDGELTAWDLQTYVQKKVSAETGKNQTPRMYNYTEDDGIFLFQEKFYKEPKTKPPANVGKTKTSIFSKKDPNKQFDNILKTNPLRSNSKTLSLDEVKWMLKDKVFFDVLKNKYARGFANVLEIHWNRPVIYDRASGLMWQCSGSPKIMWYSQAEAYIARLNQERFAGFSDWRLPTLEEAMSLMEPERKNDDLYIDSKFDKTQRYIWTSDWFNKDNYWAWIVNFYTGFCGPNDFYNSQYYVRAVCSRQ